MNPAQTVEDIKALAVKRDHIKASILTLQQEYNAKMTCIRSQQSDVEREIVKATFGVEVGCEVRSGDGNFIVAQIDARWIYRLKDGSWTKPSLKGYPVKKDGAAGKALRNIYGEWELVK